MAYILVSYEFVSSSLNDLFGFIQKKKKDILKWTSPNYQIKKEKNYLLYQQIIDNNFKLWNTWYY